MMRPFLLFTLLSGLFAIIYTQHQGLARAKGEQQRLTQALTACNAARQQLTDAYTGVNNVFLQRELTLEHYEQQVRHSDCLLLYKGQEGPEQGLVGNNHALASEPFNNRGQDAEGQRYGTNSTLSVRQGETAKTVQLGGLRLPSSHDAALRLRYRAASAIGRGAEPASPSGPDDTARNPAAASRAAHP